MSALRKLTASLLFALVSTSAFAVTDAQVFAYAEANFPSLFTGTATAGQYLQYNYRYYPASGNYLAVDTSGMISVLGPYTGGVVTPVGLVTAFAPTITAWEATQGGVSVAGLMGGAKQGTPLNLTSVVSTFAGSSSFTLADGTGTAATFGSMHGITTDGNNLYVADTSINIIRKIVLATGEVTTLAGTGYPGSVDGVGVSASFNNPQGITTDGSNLYVTDTNNGKIRKIVIATGEVTTLAGSGSPISADGTGAAASFKSPAGITTDGSNLYVTDYYTIRKIVIATGAVTTLAGGSTNASSTSSFYNPNGITTDGSNLYVTDGYTIRTIVMATGVVSILAGSGAQGSADGTGTAATFYAPWGITTDGSNLYVVELYGNRIRKIVIATGVVATVAGSGAPGFADGTGPAALFYRPFDITTDGSNLYVADSSNRRIRKIQ